MKGAGAWQPGRKVVGFWTTLGREFSRGCGPEMRIVAAYSCIRSLRRLPLGWMPVAALLDKANDGSEDGRFTGEAVAPSWHKNS